ncbi:hypothetical protein VCHA44O286_50257 [Vibrio chagasii]|nr:hypothetical protein VCHA44O286_50257 [Vibrio chagasii]
MSFSVAGVVALAELQRETEARYHEDAPQLYLAGALESNHYPEIVNFDAESC